VYLFDSIQMMGAGGGHWPTRASSRGEPGFYDYNGSEQISATSSKGHLLCL
jgi:hypothetical protein